MYEERRRGPKRNVRGQGGRGQHLGIGWQVVGVLHEQRPTLYPSGRVQGQLLGLL